MKRILTILTGILLTYVSLNAQDYPAVSYADIEASKMYVKGNEYQKDLLLYSRTLELTHPYYAEPSNAKALRKQTKRLYKECADVTDPGIFGSYLQSIISPLNDGHTQVAAGMSTDLIYPMYLMFDTKESPYVLAIEDDYKETLGKRVTLINGKPVTDLLARAHKQISGDNEIFKNDKLSNKLQIKAFWELCGYTDDAISLTFEDNTSVTIPAVPLQGISLEQLDLEFDSPISAKEVPFYYEIFDSLSVCYLQFNMCYDALNYPQLGQRFDDFVEGMMAEIDAKSVKTLVVDVRYNGGGNSGLCDLLLSYLTDYNKMKDMGCKVRMSELLLTRQPNLAGVELNDGTKPGFGDVFDFWEVKRNASEQAGSDHRLNFNPEKIFKGNVVFISGRKTFSSAGLLLTLARDNNVGIIIGETSGHRPSHFGDVLTFSLPNTGTKATVSCRHFTRPDESLNDEIELVPDVVLNLSDYTKKTDAAWEWILENCK